MGDDKAAPIRQELFSQEPFMRAQGIETFGEPDVFRVVNLADPQPGPGEAVVAIAATCVNPVDYEIGRRGPSIVPSPPAILGRDVVGTVLALGTDVSGVHLGRAACLRPGASFERVATSR